MIHGKEFCFIIFAYLALFMLLIGIIVPWLFYGFWNLLAVPALSQNFFETEARRTEVLWPIASDDQKSMGETALRRTNVVWNSPDESQKHRRSVSESDQPKQSDEGTSHIRACYFTNWAQYRPGKGKYVPENYVPGLCTHVMFAFGWMNEDFTAKAFDPADEDTSWAKGMYTRVNALKLADPNLKTMLSIGGWTFGTRLFKAMSATLATRKKFIDSVIEFIRKRNFDGFDIDWEYPVGDQDKEQFSLLIKEAHAAFEEESQRVGRPRLLLTAAVSAGEATIKSAYNIPEIAKYFDFVLLMSYDYHGAWETVTGVNSPLYGRKDQIGWQKNWNVDGAANYWSQNGMPKDKIVIGIATYGRGWTLKNPTTDFGIGAQTKGPAKSTQYVREAGVASYYELCEMLEAGATRYWHEEHQVPYLVYGDQWFGYDDEESVRNKMKWIKKNGYGGAFVWTLDFDDFDANCASSNGKKYPLISLIAEELGGQQIEATRPPVPVTSTRKPKPSPTTRAPIQILKPCLGQSDGFHPHSSSCRMFQLCLAGKDYALTCPGNFEFSSTLRYCVQKKDSNCIDQQATPPGPTPPPAETGNEAPVCNSDGFFRHPSECSEFFRCVGGVAYRFNCPGTLYFNSAVNTCDYPNNVKCS